MPDNTIEQIKERLDIVDFIRQYVPNLKRAGRSYKACCPFHQEKTPSFTCSSEKGFFYCFGCQEGGDIFAFLMKIENLSFNEALEKLAKLAGVEYHRDRPFTPEENHRATLRRLLEWAKNYYHKNLSSPAASYARSYIEKRGLTAQTCQKFELGFASDAWDNLARAACANGFTKDDLQAAGLCTPAPYGVRDYLRNRLVFPILNSRGETIAFGGRILQTGEPKYLNSPETVLFSKSHVLYGLNFAGPEIRKANRAVLLEGYMDVIGCHQAGVGYTVAPLGTSLSEEHARLLKRYSDNVIILFDPDEAGIKAALRGARILIERGLFVKVASLPEGLDPDEYILKHGRENFEKILDQAQDLITFHTHLQLQKYPQPLSAQDKTTLVSELSQTLLLQPDDIVRREWAKQVAEQVGVDEQLVLERLKQIRWETRSAYASPRTPVHASAAAGATESAEDNLLSWLLKYPQQTILCAELTENSFSNHEKWQLFQTLMQAQQQGPQEESLATRAARLAPAFQNELIRLTMLPTPADFDPARDLAACAGKLTAAGLHKELEAVRKKMKQYPSGTVPPDVFTQYVALQNKLKKYRN